MELDDADVISGGVVGAVEGAEMVELLEKGLAVVDDEGLIERISELRGVGLGGARMAVLHNTLY